MGRLTRDPELNTTPSNVFVTSFSIAVDRDYSKEDGTRDADFLNIVAWRKTAEFICRYFTKGKPIIIIGKVQTRKYTDNDSKTRYVTEIVADEVKFVLSDGTQKQNPGNGQEGYGSDDFIPIESDDELPF
jgi:single-strand DNA-binding protein